MVYTVERPSTAEVSPTSAPAALTPSPESLIMLAGSARRAGVLLRRRGGLWQQSKSEQSAPGPHVQAGGRRRTLHLQPSRTGPVLYGCLRRLPGAEEGALYVRACSASPNQRFVLSNDGAIRLGDSDLCLRSSPVTGNPLAADRTCAATCCCKAAPTRSRASPVGYCRDRVLSSNSYPDCWPRTFPCTHRRGE